MPLIINIVKNIVDDHIGVKQSEADLNVQRFEILQKKT